MKTMVFDLSDENMDANLLTQGSFGLIMIERETYEADSVIEQLR